jgi:hypothetical protein
MAIGDKYPMVPLNSVVKNIQSLADVPIRTAVFPTVFLRDVATVTDGSERAAHRSHGAPVSPRLVRRIVRQASSVSQTTDRTGGGGRRTGGVPGAGGVGGAAGRGGGCGSRFMRA